MSAMTPKDRLVENESVIRSLNEDMQEWSKENDGEHSTAYDLKADFYCECSEPTCDDRLSLSAKLYEEIHVNRKQFIVIPGHETPSIEEVVGQSDDESYLYVVKNQHPPEL